MREAPETVRVPERRLEERAAGGAGALVIRAFRLGRTPVTNREYAAFLDVGLAAPPPWWGRAAFASPRQPVVGVTWDEASAYCEWLSRSEGGRWRLPAEIEWEHAACGGLVAPRTPWGDDVPPGEIPEGDLEAPWETGRGTPNGYGLFDVGTIVHEWCLEWASPDRTPRRRASRGGSWRHTVRWSAPTARSSLPPDFRYSDYGFRVLREED